MADKASYVIDVDTAIEEHVGKVPEIMELEEINTNKAAEQPVVVEGDGGLGAFHDPTIVKKLPKVAVEVKGLTITGSTISKESKGRMLKEKVDFHVLQNVDATFLPGTMTLIIAPHGSGKSVLLAAIAGQTLGLKQTTTGKVLFNGKSPDELPVDPKKLVGFVAQGDTHWPLLTVRETLMFAQECNALPTREPEQQSAENERKVTAMIEMLGLTECADTIVGNDLIRGVSGGQKKRVTVGEMLMGNPRIVCLDEITTGLDASTALDIAVALRTWADQTGGTVISSLLQPTPEAFSQYQRVLCMQNGRVVYHGPREDAVPYFEKTLGIACPADTDYADYLTEVLTHPAVVYTRQLHMEANIENLSGEDKRNALQDIHERVNGKIPQFSNDALVAKFEQSAKPVALPSDVSPLSDEFSVQQYRAGNVHGFGDQLYVCVQRQARLFGRDKENLIMPRIMQAIMLGLIVGSFYRELDEEKAADPDVGEALRILGFLLYVPTNMAFFNMVEMPIASYGRSVTYKQLDNGFFSASTYMMSVVLVHLPLALMDTLIYGVLSYFVGGLEVAAETSLVFLGLLFVFNLAMSSLFRSVALWTPGQGVAQVVGPVLVASFMLFSGFLITKDNIPIWLRWIYYISPFAWVHRAMSNNQMHSQSFDDAALIQGEHAGDWLLGQYEIPTGDIWIWTAVLVILGFYFLFIFVGIISIKYLRWANPTGTKRHNTLKTIGGTSIDIEDGAKALDFQKVNLAWKDIIYDVPIKVDKETVQKRLLRGVSAVAEPGRLMALMGASGAGKTTLMDVIAGRKTMGTIQGHIYVQGQELEPDLYQDTIGYVEQFDAHLPFQTIREAVEFSAKLRLDAKVTDERRTAAIDEVLEVLELTKIQHREVGDANGGISAGQRKVLSIAVELVSNPSIIFLDEPTTGLDSRSALMVMQAIRNVAATDRTVVCTIHQPSAEVFFMFDDLLLLEPGGVQVYAGPVGHRGSKIVSYFESLDVVKNPMPKRMNPASWMLEILATQGGYKEGERRGSKGGNSDDSPFGPLYEQSEAADSLNKNISTNRETTRELAKKQKVSAGKRFSAVLDRLWKSLYRNKPYNAARFVMFPFLALIYGCIYYNLNTSDLAGLQSSISNLAVSGAFVSVIFLQAGAPVVMSQRATFYREQAAQMYPSSFHGIAAALVEIPFIVVLDTMFLAIMYFMVGYRSDAGIFFHTLLNYLLLSLAMTYMGHFFVSVAPMDQVVQIMNGFFQGLFWLFNGVFNPASGIPKGWIWFYRFAPYNKLASSCAVLQFHESTDTVIINPPNGVVPQDEFLEEIYEFEYSERWFNTLIMLCYVFGFLGLALLGWKYVRHIRR